MADNEQIGAKQEKPVEVAQVQAEAKSDVGGKQPQQESQAKQGREGKSVPKGASLALAIGAAVLSEVFPTLAQFVNDLRDLFGKSGGKSNEKTGSTPEAPERIEGKEAAEVKNVSEVGKEKDEPKIEQGAQEKGQDKSSDNFVKNLNSKVNKGASGEEINKLIDNRDEKRNQRQQNRTEMDKDEGLGADYEKLFEKEPEKVTAESVAKSSSKFEEALKKRDAGGRADNDNVARDVSAREPEAAKTKETLKDMHSSKAGDLATSVSMSTDKAQGKANGAEGQSR